MITKEVLAEHGVDLLLQKSVSAAERKSDYHAGPHNSFPIGPAGEHLKAAWDLAGHAANPDKVRSNILRFAHEHGLSAHLPQAAHDHAKKNGMVKKATSEDVRSLYQVAWDNAAMGADPYMHRRLVRHAEEQGLQQHLPEAAHGMMHDMCVPHNHDGMKNDPETGLHVHTVVKAFNPVAIEGVVVKSWVVGDTAYLEGWLSTPRKDMEKDVTEPEAFLPGLSGYFARSAPLSLEHGTKRLPIGHLQKAAIVRDGNVLKAASHPHDPGEFEHFPGSGTGVWARAAVNTPDGVEAIRKGNVGGFSFIANAPEYEPLPGGRFRYTKLDPWIESTIAAYPINPDAVIAVAKAFGLKEEEHMTLSLEEILAEAAAKVEADKQAQDAQTITKADLGSVLGELKTTLVSDVKALIAAEVAEVKKAFDEGAPQRGEGVGRKGTVDVQKGQTGDPTLEDDPAAYIVKKATNLPDDYDYDKHFSPIELHLIGQITKSALLDGLI